MAGMGALDLGVSVLLWFERFCVLLIIYSFFPSLAFAAAFSLLSIYPFLFVFCLSNTSFPFGHNGMAVRWRGYGWRYLSVCILLILYVPHSPSSI